MKPPQWLAEEIASTGVRVLDGKMTRAEGDAAIAAATREHPEYGAEKGAADAVSLFARWMREHATSGDLFQSQTFPGLPASLMVAPKRTTAIADMTAGDLDKARNMLYARTTNAIEGVTKAAEQERAAFDDFYDRVRPMLTGDKTVGDVMDKIAAQDQPAAEDAA